jgi:hypothetical protein
MQLVRRAGPPNNALQRDARHCDYFDGALLVPNSFNGEGIEMNSKQVASAMFVAFGLASSTAAMSQSSKDMVDVKTPSELRELFSNKTFKGSTWTAHYRADGKGQFIQANRKPEPSTWTIKGEDQVCITIKGANFTSNNCYRYQWHKQNRAWVTQTSIASNAAYMFTLEDGIPKF